MKLIYMRAAHYTDPRGIRRKPYVPFEVDDRNGRVMWGRERFLCDADRLARLVRNSTDASIVLTASRAGRPGLTPDQARAFVGSLLDEPAPAPEPERVEESIADAVASLDATADEYDVWAGMSRDELRELCRARGLGTGRSRDELLAKLVNAGEAEIITMGEEE